MLNMQLPMTTCQPPDAFTKLLFEKCCGAMILSSVLKFCVLTHINNDVHGFAFALH